MRKIPEFGLLKPVFMPLFRAIHRIPGIRGREKPLHRCISGIRLNIKRTDRFKRTNGRIPAHGS